jgi:hypothetical protein
MYPQQSWKGSNLMKIVLTEEDIQKQGSASLVGMIMSETHELPQEVELVFPQTGLGWREENGGPLAYIIHEYNIPCLLESVLYLIDKGVNVSISMPEE